MFRKVSLISMLLGVAGAAPALSTESGLVLIQKSAKGIKEKKDVALTEEGYQFVASMKDDKEMLAYINRVLTSEGRVSTSPGDLSGLVPFYSGTKSVQSLNALKSELNRFMGQRREWGSHHDPRVQRRRPQGYIRHGHRV
jgi:hypothetical protein